MSVEPPIPGNNHIRTERNQRAHSHEIRPTLRTHRVLAEVVKFPVGKYGKNHYNIIVKRRSNKYYCGMALT